MDIKINRLFQHNLQKLQAHIRLCATESNQAEPRCIVVTKNRPIESIKEFYDLGVRDFGENYPSEAIPKIKALQAYPEIRWHFIGHIQSRVAQDIALYFDHVHSLDRLKTALKLNMQCLKMNKRLSVLLQINISQDVNKHGISPSVLSIETLLQDCAKLKALEIKGFMIMPEASDTGAFVRMKALADAVNQTKTPMLSMLSMGMSNDYAQAITAGATEIRVGRLLFEEESIEKLF